MRNQRIHTLMLLSVTAAAGLSGCAKMDKSGGEGTTGTDAAAAAAIPAATEAMAKLKPTKGNKASGEVRFVQSPEGVKVTGTIMGLSPNSVHGFHIHEKGDCSAPDAASAGAHYDPDKAKHGDIGPGSHKGDLGNIKADAKGRAKIELTVPSLALSGPQGTLADRGVIVHADPDDLTTQPSGASGARIACGSISITK